MKHPHLLIVGCGDIGSRVAERLLTGGWQISAARRRPALLPRGIDGYVGDYTEPGGLSALVGLEPDICLFTPLPASRDAAGYQLGFHDGVREIAATGVFQHCQRLLYVSSTRVYAEQQGGVVDEQSALTASDAMGVAIQAGEQLARSLLPTTVIRPAGVYGAEPAMLVERVRSGAFSADPGRISNRIHRDDLAGLLALLSQRAINNDGLPEVLNAADDEPAPIGTVEAWLAARLEIPVQMGSGGKSVRGNRRVSNQLLHKLGYELRYPTWREGYAELLTK